MGVTGTSQSLLGALLLTLAAAIWGGMYVVSKLVMEVIPPFALLCLRLVLGTAVLAAWVRAGRAAPPRRADLARLAGLGFVGLTVSVGAQFLGTHLSSAAAGALITAASPAFIAGFAAWLLKERLTPKQLGALALATAGVVLVVGTEGVTRGPRVLAGTLYLAAAAVTWALYSVLAKAATRRLPALVVTAGATGAGAVFSLPLAAAELRRAPVDWGGLGVGVWAGVLYLGVIATALAFYCWNRGFELLPASTAGLFFFVQPVVGAALGWALRDEALGAGYFGGAAAIALSLALASRSQPAPVRPSSPAGTRGQARPGSRRRWPPRR